MVRPDQPEPRDPDDDRHGCDGETSRDLLRNEPERRSPDELSDPEMAARCVECDRASDRAEADGFTFWSDGVGELHALCPDCARKEFGYG
jgi:hypothetical protein